MSEIKTTGLQINCGFPIDLLFEPFFQKQQFPIDLLFGYPEN